MANNVERTAVLEDREVLRSAAGLNDIKSGVIAAHTVPQWLSSGRYLLPKGTVMAKLSGDDQERLCPVTHSGGGSGSSGAYVAADIVGILAAKVEFAIGPDVPADGALDNASNQDEPCALLHHGCNFDVRYLTGYSGRESVVAAALPTCLFTDVS